MSLKSRLTEIAQYSFNFSECANEDLPSFLDKLHSNICPELDSEAKIIASMAFQWRFVTQLLKYAVKKSFTNAAGVARMIAMIEASVENTVTPAYLKLSFSFSSMLLAPTTTVRDG